MVSNLLSRQVARWEKVYFSLVCLNFHSTMAEWRDWHGLLALRFPEIEVENETYSTADVQRDRAGDFVIGDTAFHVTMTPMDKVYERCRENVKEGRRAYLLVPDDHVQSTRRRAKDEAPGRVVVESIESFVGQNIEEMAVFSQKTLNERLHELLETYNRRVEAIEVDKSVMIKIPPNLRPKNRQA